MHLLEDEQVFLSLSPSPFPYSIPSSPRSWLQILIKTRINALLRDSSDPTNSTGDDNDGLDTEVIPRGSSLLSSRAEEKISSIDSPRRSGGGSKSSKEAFQQSQQQGVRGEAKGESKESKGVSSKDNRERNREEELRQTETEGLAEDRERQLKEKLKEDHRKGLSQLKSSLQSTRAMEIGSFQQQVSLSSHLSVSRRRLPSVRFLTVR
jgi:hypothetical protein